MGKVDKFWERNHTKDELSNYFFFLMFEAAAFVINRELENKPLNSRISFVIIILWIVSVILLFRYECIVEGNIATVFSTIQERISL